MATTTTTAAAVMAPSVLWVFISSMARLRRVEEASPGGPGRILLSFTVLIVAGDIPPILHCGRCHTLNTDALDYMLCSAARCFWQFCGSKKLFFFRNLRWWWPLFPRSRKPVSKISEPFRVVLGKIIHV